MRLHLVSTFLGSAAIALGLTSCGGTDNNINDNELNISRSSDGFVAYFAPASSVIPYPSNLLFSGRDVAASDITLNIPVEDPEDYSDPKVALNALDGFSTIAPMTTTFSLPLEPATINGQTVHIFEVTLADFASVVAAVNSKLTYGQDYVAGLSPLDTTNKTLSISLLRPLKAKTSYMVALTTGIQSSDGRSVTPDITYSLSKSTSPIVVDGVSQVSILTDAKATALAPIQALTNYQEAALAGQGISSDSVALSWTFSTQSISDVLTTVKTMSQSYGPTTDFTPTRIGTTADFIPGGPGAADIFVGTLTLPYYLSKAAHANDPTPLSKYWTDASNEYLTQDNTTPNKTSDETIPVLLSVPTGAGIGLKPVVIFQHGITQNRTNLIAVADSLAAAGFIGIAIDLPLHGLAPGHTVRAATPSVSERTFDLDLANNTTGASGPDSVADESGTHFINLRNLLVTRDNVRQSVADLFALKESLASLDYNKDSNLDIDTSRIYFYGNSLGGIVGTPFLALESDVKDAVLAVTGSGIAKLLDGSATFGPIIAAGLAASGVEKGTADYESFMGAAQTVIDSGDPANYATGAANNRGILFFEVVGDGADNPADLVIPNNVLADAPSGTIPSPLAGSDPLIALLGLSQVSSTTSSTSDMKSYIRFTKGFHGSLLDPVNDALANATTTTVMQSAAATFFATDGLQVSISNTSVVE